MEISQELFNRWQALMGKVMRAAHDYAVTEESWLRFENLAGGAEDFLRTHFLNNPASTLKNVELELALANPANIGRRFSRAADLLLDKAEGGVPTLQDALDAMAARRDEIQGKTKPITSVDELDAFLGRMEKLGAVLHPVDAYLVHPDAGRIEERKSATPKEFKIEFRPKIMSFMAALEERGIYPQDIRFISGQPEGRHVRPIPYLILDIPRLNAQVAITDHYGEITYAAVPALENSLWWGFNKDELNAHPFIQRIHYREDGGWISEIFEKIGLQPTREENRQKFPQQKIPKPRGRPLGKNYLRQLIDWHRMYTAQEEGEIKNPATRSGHVFIPEFNVGGEIKRNKTGKIIFKRTDDTWMAINAAIVKGRSGVKWVKKEHLPYGFKEWSLPAIVYLLGYNFKADISDAEKLRQLIDWHRMYTKQEEGVAKNPTQYSGAIYIPENDNLGNIGLKRLDQITFRKTDDTWRAIHLAIFRSARDCDWLKREPLPLGFNSWSLHAAVHFFGFNDKKRKTEFADISSPEKLKQLIAWHRMYKEQEEGVASNPIETSGAIYIPMLGDKGEEIHNDFGKITFLKTEDTWKAVSRSLSYGGRGTIWTKKERLPHGFKKWTLAAVVNLFGYIEKANISNPEMLKQLIEWYRIFTEQEEGSPRNPTLDSGRIYIPEFEKKGIQRKHPDGSIAFRPIDDTWRAVDGVLRLSGRKVNWITEEWGPPPAGKNKWSLSLAIERLGFPKTPIGMTPRRKPNLAEAKQ